MASVIIPGKKIAKTRSEQAEIIKKEWGGHGGLSEAQLDTCKFAEKKVRDKYGERAANFLSDDVISRVKSAHDKR